MENHRIELTIDHCIIEVETIIETRISYLFSHYKYLRGIQKGEICLEDKQAYFVDIFGLKLSIDEINNNVLMQLIEVVEIHLRLYQELRKATHFENKEIATSLLYVLIDYQFGHSFHLKKIMDSKLVNKEYKFQAAFNDYNILKLLKNILKPFLSESYTALSQIIVVRGIFEQKKEIRGTETTFRNAVSYRWDEFGKKIVKLIKARAELKNETPRNESKNTVRKEKQQEFIQFLSQAPKDFPQEQLQSFMQVFQMAGLVKQRMQLNKNAPTGTDIERLALLRENVLFFYESYPIFSKFTNLVTSYSAQLDAINLKNKAVKYYNNTATQIKSSIVDLLEKLSSVANRIHALVVDEQYQQTVSSIQENLSAMKENLEEVYSLWSKECPEEIKNNKEVEELENEFNKNCKKIEVKLKKFSSFCNQIGKVPSLSTTNKTDEIIRLNYEENKRQREQRVHYLNQRAEENKAYKDNVNRKREEKSQLARYSAILPRKEIQFSTIHKNENMEKLLDQLSDYHINLIKSILRHEKNIKSSEVYTLITNHLGGTISEIGNGSSHKRIQLQKAYVEIITYTDGSRDNVTDKAVGGFFRQHSKGHNSQELCKFNLKLIADVFAKANLSLDAMDELVKRRSCTLLASPLPG